MMSNSEMATLVGRTFGKPLGNVTATPVRPENLNSDVLAVLANDTLNPRYPDDPECSEWWMGDDVYSATIEVDGVWIEIHRHPTHISVTLYDEEANKLDSASGSVSE